MTLSAPTAAERMDRDPESPYSALWCAVVTSAVREYQAEYFGIKFSRQNAEAKAQSVLDRARRYFDSSDGREVCTLAGLTPSAKLTDGLIAAIATPKVFGVEDSARDTLGQRIHKLEAQRAKRVAEGHVMQGVIAREIAASGYSADELRMPNARGDRLAARLRIMAEGKRLGVTTPGIAEALGRQSAAVASALRRAGAGVAGVAE